MRDEHNFRLEVQVPGHGRAAQPPMPCGPLPGHTINQVRRPVYNDRNRGTESVRISNRHSCSQYHQLTTLRGPDLTRE
jgi:hypothetical protein